MFKQLVFRRGLIKVYDNNDRPRANSYDWLVRENLKKISCYCRLLNSQTILFSNFACK